VPAADRLPTEFDLRERQRQEEIRRRQVSRHVFFMISYSIALSRGSLLKRCYWFVVFCGQAGMQL